MARAMTESEIAAAMKSLHQWTREGNEIKRRCDFPDFAGAMGFVTSVALLAERANHHPDIDIRWNRVLLVLSTHSVGGLTTNDFDLAAQIDRIPGASGPDSPTAA